MQRVLLAEDDPKLRGQLIDLLSARDFVVEAFEEGEIPVYRPKPA